MDDPSVGLLLVFGTFIVFALLGLAGSCVYQFREWRKRRMMAGRK